MEHWGKRVREVEDASRSDDAGEAREVRNGGPDHVRNRPVDRDDGDPGQPAAADREWGSFEELDEDVVVQD